MSPLAFHSFLAFVVLLEGVVDGEGEARVHLLPQHGEGPAEALLEVQPG
jgi:hypothetical protein